MRLAITGGTALLSDLFFIASYLDMVENPIGEVERVEPLGVVAVSSHTEFFIAADLLIKCVGFHPNLSTEQLLERNTMRGIGLVDENLWVKGEPHVDNGIDTNAPLAHSIFYGMPFFCKVVMHFWHSPDRMAHALAANLPEVGINSVTLSEW